MRLATLGAWMAAALLVASGTGCAAIMAASNYDPSAALEREGATRAGIEEQLGKPYRVSPGAGGTVIAEYRYQYLPPDFELAGRHTSRGGGGELALLAQLASEPFAMAEVASRERLEGTATVSYRPDGTVAWYFSTSKAQREEAKRQKERAKLERRLASEAEQRRLKGAGRTEVMGPD